MSAKIALENVSVGVTLNSKAAPRPVPTSRPIENAGATSADSDSSRNRAFGRKITDGDKAEPGVRPPGKDPSVLPQSLFDAALISSQYKAQTKPAPVSESQVEAQANAAATENTAKTAESDTRQDDTQGRTDQTARPNDAAQNSSGRAPVSANESVANLEPAI